MQVKRTKRMFFSRERRVAKRSFLNSCERPSALATAVATPILRSSCMSRNSRSTDPFFHDSPGNGGFSLVFAHLCLGRGEPRGRKCRDVEAWYSSGHHVGHNSGGYRRQQDAVAEVAAGDEEARRTCRAEDGKIIGSAGAQASPGLDGRG